MRDKALLGLMVLLAGMGALVNFTSAILSFLADFMMMGAAVACAILVYRHQQEHIAALKSENKLLREESTRKELHAFRGERERAQNMRAPK